MASYSGNPTSAPFFDGGARFTDVFIQGAGPDAMATVKFYYPQSISGDAETRHRLAFFTGTAWVAVLSSGGVPPDKNTEDNLDATASGGRFTVVFDMTSTPKVTELNGTVFADGQDVTPPVLHGVPTDLAHIEATGPTTPGRWPAPTAIDDLDGAVPVICTPASGAGFPMGSTTVTCTATDVAGNRTTGSFTVTVRDTTPPVVGAARSPAPNANGWNNSDVTVSFTCSDALSGVDACSPPTTLGEGANQSVTGAVTDKAGNSASTTVSGINIDQTAPTITASQSPPATADGWNNTDVTVSFACTDALSGVATPCPSPTTLTAAGAGQTVTWSVTDQAGNSASATWTVNIDKTAPEAANQFDPAALALAVVGRDGGSGVASVVLVSSVPVKWGDDDDEKETQQQAELRTYKVTDQAGNTLLLVEKVKQEGKELKATKVSLQYNSGPVITLGPNQIKLEWSVDKKDGALKELEQKITVGKGKDKQEVQAKFDAKKNETTIWVKEKGKDDDDGKKVVKPGLALLRLATDQGKLAIEYSRSFASNRLARLTLPGR